MGSYLMNGKIPQSLVFFVFIYFMSFMIVLGCESWFLLWFGLEVNMISFISVIYSRSMMSIESCMKYFFIQGVGSGMLLGSLYLSWLENVNLVSLILSYKMGAGPFFYWFPSVCEGLSWWSCLILMTLQSVMPLLLISLFMGIFIWIVVGLSLIVGVMGAFNESKLKKLLAFSSIHHMGWLLMGNFLGGYMWMFYWLGYSFMMLGLIYILSDEEVINLNDLIFVESKFILVMSMLNMAGIPPMFGFFLKWGVFYFLFWQFNVFLVLMIILSVFMMYIYIRMIYGVMSGSVFLLVLCKKKKSFFVNFVSWMSLLVSLLVGSFILVF